MSLKINAKIEMEIDPKSIESIPNGEVCKAVGNLILRFSFWECDEVAIYNDGKKGDMIAYFRKDGKTKFVLGAVWRQEQGTYTYHS